MINERKAVYNLGKIIYNLMLSCCAIVLVVCFITTSDKPEIDTPMVEIKPYTVANLEDGSKEYFFDLTDFDSRYSGVMFFTSHQSVVAYNSGRPVYSFTKTGGFWGSTTGSTYNFISVNEKMINVAVIIKPMYDIVADKVPTFYVGASYQMYDDLVKNSIANFCVSLFIIIFSIILFAYYIVLHKKLNLGKELIFLAFFAFFVGMWTLNETDLAVLIVGNRILDSLIPYVCLMMVVPPFVLFFDSYLGINGLYIKKIVIILSMLVTVTCTVLHFTKIAEFRETLIFIQLMIFLALVYVTGAVVIQIIRRDFSRQVRICLAGLVLFFISTIVDISNYYTGVGDADKIGRYMLLLFVLLLSWDLIRGTNEIIEKGRHAKQLEIFALTDKMTGLYNRNAFESHADTEKNLDGVIAVVVDANGLKTCNDTYGHDAGDEYITIVAEIFNNVFGRYGNCYRTGGDEFCCIIPAGRGANMERLKKLFVTKVYTANLEEDHQYEIGAAIGSAQYDGNIDTDFRSLIKRADESMYENKKASKCI